MALSLEKPRFSTTTPLSSRNCQSASLSRFSGAKACRKPWSNLRALPVRKQAQGGRDEEADVRMSRSKCKP